MSKLQFKLRYYEKLQHHHQELQFKLRYHEKLQHHHQKLQNYNTNYTNYDKLQHHHESTTQIAQP